MSLGLREDYGPSLTVDEFRSMLRPQPHGLHNIDDEQVKQLIAILGHQFGP